MAGPSVWEAQTKRPSGGARIGGARPQRHLVRVSSGSKLPQFDVEAARSRRLAPLWSIRVRRSCPASDTLKAAIDLNTAAAVKAAQANQANARQMANVAATIASSVLGILGVSAPTAAGGWRYGIQLRLRLLRRNWRRRWRRGDAFYHLQRCKRGLRRAGRRAGIRRAGPDVAAVAALGGGGRPSGGFSSGIGGFASMFKNLKTTDWGGFTRSGGGFGDALPGSTVSGGTNGGKITGMHGAAGTAVLAGGSMLAQQGLLGSSRGTWGGRSAKALSRRRGHRNVRGRTAWRGHWWRGRVRESASAKSWRASRRRKTRPSGSLSRSTPFKIDNNLAKQIAGIAQQSYGGNVGMAVRKRSGARPLAPLGADHGPEDQPDRDDTAHTPVWWRRTAGCTRARFTTTARHTPMPARCPLTAACGLRCCRTPAPYAGSVNVTLNPQQTVDLWRTGTAQAIQSNPRAVASSALAGSQQSATRSGSLAAMVAPGVIFQ